MNESIVDRLNGLPKFFLQQDDRIEVRKWVIDSVKSLLRAVKGGFYVNHATVR